jgi:hypothetical protein
MERTHGTSGGEVKCVQSFGRKNLKEKTIWNT